MDKAKRLKEKIERFRRKVASWELSLEIEHDGRLLRGRIYYNKKDYFPVLEEPRLVIGVGGHLPYGIAIGYAAPGDTLPENWKSFDLPGTEVLVVLYATGSDRESDE